MSRATFDVLNINFVNAICDHSTSDKACDNGQKVPSGEQILTYGCVCCAIRSHKF
jgi:hypothetical protein